MAHQIKLIVGLGNPGREYTDTRHNAGAWLAANLAQQFQVNLKSIAKLKGLCAKINSNENECLLFIPLTFMNLSGTAVRAITKFYKLSPEEILVAHDELDFPPGVVKIKQGGGHGGHNGLRDIIAHLHSNNFYRLRIGIGHPGNRDLVSDYVLHNPSKADAQKIDQAISDALTIIPDIIAGNLEQAMQKLH